jgi:phage terminase small subunit
MPRKSAAALAGEHWRELNAPPPPPPPQPPSWLSAAAAKHWRAIVASRPPDYFDAANQVLLEILCSSMATADAIAAEIRALGEINVSNKAAYRRWRALLVMQARETRMMTLLTTKLRLLPTRAQAERARQHRPPAWDAR